MRQAITYILFVLTTCAYAQSNEVIEVSYDKSVLVTFGSSDDPGALIAAFNCGNSEDVGVTKRQNKIILQANVEYFSETNLLVELKNGDVFAFILKYNNGTQKLIHKIGLTSPYQVVESNEISSVPPANGSVGTKKEPVKQDRDFVQVQSESKPTVSSLEDAMFWGEQYSKKEDYLKRLAVVENKFIFYVGGIWVKEDKIYFKIKLVNDSPISYDIKSRNFYIKAKKSIVPEKVNLIGIYNDKQTRIDAKSTATYVAVFEKFTIADPKVFVIQFWEKGGERNLELTIKPVELLNAKLGL